MREEEDEKVMEMVEPLKEKVITQNVIYTVPSFS